MATWDERNCQSFETAARGFEHGFSRLSARRSKRHAAAPHDLRGTVDEAVREEVEREEEGRD